MSTANPSSPKQNPFILALEKHFAKRTPEQKRQGLIDAGILTKKGNVAKPYAILFDKKNRKAPQP